MATPQQRPVGMMANMALPPPTSIPQPHPFPLEEILTPGEQSTLTDDIKGKLNQSLDELTRQIHTLKTTAHAEKVVYVQHTYDLDTQLTTQSAAFASLKATLESATIASSHLAQENASLTGVNAKLEQEGTVLKLNLENAEQRLSNLSDANSELLAIVEKRNVEIEKLSNEVLKLGNQLESTSLAKIEAMQKVDELLSREIEIKYREKHLLSEQSYQADQLKMLNQELERKSIQLLNTQRDASVGTINIQTELAEKIEHLKISEMKLADLKELYEKSEKQVENLMDKLRNEGELRSKVEENYRVEVGSLKRVVELYKESSEDSTKKLEELEDAVQNLQDLLKESTEKYGQLETRFADSSRQQQDEISKRDEIVGKLKQELKTANEVLESIQKHGMTDEMIHSLSPAAAAASQMLKESNSITEIFSKYQEVQVELGRVKCDNLKLNGYIREILEDIETRAPTLQKQKEEYERAVQTVEILSSQMDVTMRENSNCKTEIVQLKKNLGVAERENSRLKGQIEDLARQVRCLLGEQQRMAIDSGDQSVMMDSATSHDSSSRAIDGGQVITNALTTFKDIGDLQKQNLRLLTVVRELTEQREKNEKEHEVNSMREIKSSFSIAMTELSELKQMRLRQDEKIKEIQHQRDSLTTMLKQRDANNSSNSDVTAEKLKETEIKLAKLNEDFGTYKAEKRENERMLNESSEKLRGEILRVRSENGKLAGQVEYNNERTKIYHKNLEGYKKQIAVLEEKNRTVNELLARHELSINSLKAELQTTHTTLSRAEVSITTLTNERNILRENKNRLQLEKEMLQRHEKMSNLLQTNLEEIKNNMEMSNSSLRIKLENQVESLKAENAILKRRIDSESERNRDSLSLSELKLRQAKEKLSAEEEKVVKLSESNAQSLEKIEQLNLEVASLKQIEYSSSVEPSQPQENNNIELITLKSELESLKSQLQLCKSNINEYRSLTTVLEEQLSLANETTSSVSSEFELKVSEKEGVIETTKVELENVQKEFQNFKMEATLKISQISKTTNELENEIKKVTEEYSIARGNLLQSQQELDRIKSDLANEGKIKEELSNRLDAEMISRMEKSKELSNLKQRCEKLVDQVESELKLKRQLEEALSLKETEFSTKEDTYLKELSSLKDQVKDYREACDKLELQLTSVLANKSTEQVDLTGDGKSGEQWLQLIRFLRREKEIAVSKMEMSLASNDRLESQFKALQNQYDEVKLELGRVSGGENAVGLLTSVKQADLLRKVETLSALSDSNRHLREETNTLKANLESVSTQLSTIQTTTIDPLRLQLSQLEQENDQLTLQNQSLKESSVRWQKRANELIEKTNKVNPEEMKRLQQENETFNKRSVDLDNELKRVQQEFLKLDKQLKLAQGNVVNLKQEVQSVGLEKGKFESDVKRLTDEALKTGSELDRVKAEVSNLKKELEMRSSEMDRLKEDSQRLEGSVEEHKQTVKQVKNIARKYKKQYEDSLGNDSSAQHDQVIIELRNELESLKNDKAQTEQDNATVLDELRAQLEQANRDKEQGDTVLQEEFRNKINDLTMNITQLTTEKTTILQEKQVENERLKSELDMLRQRLALIEKIHQQKKDHHHTEVVEDNKLTASIRPMTVKEQKLIVVTPQQNVVQPMVQQQQQQSSSGPSTSANANSSQSVVISQSLQSPTNASATSGPVSQAQVSSSGGSSSVDKYNQQAQQRVVSIQPHVQEVLLEDDGGDEEEEEDEQQVDDDGSEVVIVEVDHNEVEQNSGNEVSSSLSNMMGVGGTSNTAGHVEASSSTNNNKRERECDESGSSSTTGANKRRKFDEDEEHEDDDDDEDEENDEEEEEDERMDDDDHNDDGHDDDDSREREAESAGGTNTEDDNAEQNPEDQVVVMAQESDQENRVHDEHPISSSTLSMLQPPQTSAFSAVPSSQYQTEHYHDASIVPSTPTLFRHHHHGRNDHGFSELTTTTRFSFTNSGMDEDMSGSGGRSVPSTPAPVMVTDEDDIQEVVDLDDHDDEEEREERDDDDDLQVVHEEQHEEHEEQNYDVLVPTTHASTTTSTAEVPSSSTTLSQQSSSQESSSNQQKPRPTPIVWDQPTSSSSTQGPQQPMPSSFRGIGRPRGSFSYRNPSISTTFNPRMSTLRGVPPALMMRARGSQSARRSRPGIGLRGRGTGTGTGFPGSGSI